MVGGGASFFLAPLIVTGFATLWGWRGSFMGLAIPAIVLGTVAYVLMGRWGDTKRPRHRKTTGHSGTPTPGRRRHLISFMILSTFTQAIIVSTIAFIPLFMVDHFGIDKEVAPAFLAIIYSAGLWVAPLGGHLSDRLGKLPVTLTACFIIGPVIYLLNLAPYGLGIGAVLLAIGIIMIIRRPVSEADIISQTPERHRSKMLGIYYFGGMEGSGLLTPVMGYLID